MALTRIFDRNLVRRLRKALAEGRAANGVGARRWRERTGTQGRNTYLWQDAAWTLAEAARAEAMPRAADGPFGDGRSALWGLPVSVKDCFDLAGAPTSCGVRFYRDLNGDGGAGFVAGGAAARGGRGDYRQDASASAGLWHHRRESGVWRLHCSRGDAGALTGGSSTGAAASVLEGSAVAAIGTDTGGSVRVPAALCGLAGYRASLGRGDWRGGVHLAESFDTMGWLFRDLEDAPLLADSLRDAATAAQAVYKLCRDRSGISARLRTRDCGRARQDGRGV